MIQLIIEPLLFITFIVICLYLPGKFLLSRLKLDISSPEDIFLPLGLGIILFTFIAYILSWIKLEILILPILIILDAFVIKSKLYFPKRLERIHYIPLGITSVLSLIFSLTMLITGKYGNNILIRHDDLWHLALINELKVHFPPYNPSFAGIPLNGYHFFYDFFVAKISNIFLISPLSLHFHLIPLFLAFMWGLGVYALLFKWSNKTSAGLWAVFLTMFGGSFAFILYLQGHTTVSLDNGLGIGSLFGSLYNPPLSISLVIIITTLFIIYHYLLDKRHAWLIPMSLCIGMVSMFKVYAGIILLGAFLLLVALQLIKRNYRIILSFIAVVLLFWGTYWIFAGGSGSLIFFPLWAPHKLLQSFPWYNYDNKIYVYSHLHVIHGLVETEAYGLILFILGNLGTTLLGIATLFLLFFKKGRRWPSIFAILLFVMLLISITIPLFFIQTGKVFEIIQMGEYYLFFCSLFAALGFAVFFDLKFNKYIKGLLIIAVVILTVPHLYNTVFDYYGDIKTFQSLENPYFQTMHYLSSIGKYDDTVLELPPKEVLPNDQSLLSWYYQSSNPSITAIANKRTYFDNEYIDFPNLDIKSRLNFIKDVLVFIKNNSTDSTYAKKGMILANLLKDKNIKYIYASYEIPLFNHSHNIIQIYQKGHNVLYKLL